MPPTSASTLLALQRRVGNRAAASIVARRVIDIDPNARLVRLTVGVELTTKLSQRAWELTANGPLDEAGVETLRQIALEHWFGTIDDNERLFIAGLLDRSNAASLHAAHPHDFPREGSTIEFSAASMTRENRRIVQDSGRGTRPEPGASERAETDDKLDQDILAMGRPGFVYTVSRVLRLADQARIDHVALYFAMLNGASDSTAGDRALAAAVFVVARREGMAVAEDILHGRLKVDEVSSGFLGVMHAHGVYSSETDGRLKADTLYLPTSFDMDNLAYLGTLVHELQHASDDAAVARLTSRSRLDVEEAAYERQSRFLLVEFEKLTGDARARAETAVAQRIGLTHVYLMIVAALEATVVIVAALEATDNYQFAERSRIIAEINYNIAQIYPGAERSGTRLSMPAETAPRMPPPDRQANEVNILPSPRLASRQCALEHDPENWAREVRAFGQQRFAGRHEALPGPVVALLQFLMHRRSTRACHASNGPTMKPTPLVQRVYATLPARAGPRAHRGARQGRHGIWRRVSQSARSSTHGSRSRRTSCHRDHRRHQAIRRRYP